MDGIHPYRSRDQYGNGRETSSLEAAAGSQVRESIEESCPARKHARSQGLRRCLRKLVWKTRPGHRRGFAPARLEGALPAHQLPEHRGHAKG